MDVFTSKLFPSPIFPCSEEGNAKDNVVHQFLFITLTAVKLVTKEAQDNGLLRWWYDVGDMMSLQNDSDRVATFASWVKVARCDADRLLPFGNYVKNVW